MKLQTQCYLPEPPREAIDPTLGLRDLRKGLNTMLVGYLLFIAAILGAVGIVVYLIVQLKGGALSKKAVDDAAIVIFTLFLLLPLTSLFSVALIIRGKWLCLMSAPEAYHAKWMMYLSILCVLAGPLLNYSVYILPSAGDVKPAVRGRAAKANALTRMEKEIDEFKDGMPEMSTTDWIQLVGKGIGMLSSVFFVLFLRAVALTWGAPVRARFAELYLLFLALLVAGLVVLIRNPALILARPQLLLGLGAGWLLVAPWYFGLILSTSIGVSYLLARGGREPLPIPPPAPRLAAFPPIE